MVRGGKIDNLHAIFVPIGDGNHIAGIAAYIKRVFPKVKVFGVEESNRSVMAWSFYKDKRVLFVKQNGEVLVEAIGEECFSICVEFLDGIMIVDEHAISTANEEITKDIGGDVSALCIAGVQCYCSKYVGEVCNKNIVAVIDE
uniref:threonine dehydratase biosynthetic, chloroplastic-like n=1 Tax=Fragaria vesca subsp. vesca TaxID=101020 RepID=UPI0005CA2ED2|nr:PREDICTED: threonine dehydratase biosynthetic, chloroplastic-like [Fragaria vesca subsp. vesca]